MARRVTAVDRHELIAHFETLFIPEPNSGCWLWIGTIFCRDYGYFRKELAHRVSYRLYKGPIPDGLGILHTCDVGGCVNPDHLYAGTHQQNMRDAAVRNRFRPARGADHPFVKWPELVLRGEKHGRALLTEAEVLEILADTTTRTAVLARHYGVSWSTVKFIRIGRNWRHLQAASKEAA